MDEEKKTCPGCGDTEFDGECCLECGRLYCLECGKLIQGEPDEPRACQCPPPACGAGHYRFG